MEAPALHVGMIGVGRIGVFHVQTLQALQGVSRLTIADADPARALQVARDLGVDAAETPEALVQAGVDALVIATATPGHAPLLHLAASAGLPAFCEKPVALELAALDDVLAEVDRAGILVQIGFQRRFDAGYRAAHDAVAAGALGNLLVVRAATHDPSPPAQDACAGQIEPARIAGEPRVYFLVLRSRRVGIERQHVATTIDDGELVDQSFEL